MENKNTEKVRKGRFTYLINRDDGTAWIADGTTGRKKKYTLPVSVEIEGRVYVCESVEIGAFRGRRKLQHLTMPDTYNYLDEGCFLGCKNLRSVHIGTGLEYYSNWSFGGCMKLRRVTIDRNNPYLKMSEDGTQVLSRDGKTVYAVIQKFTLESLRIPEGVEKIAPTAIAFCKKLSSLTLPSTLKEIGPNGIFENHALRSLTVPEGVTKVISQAISFNEGLERLDLPSTLREINNCMLDGSCSLKALILRSDTVVGVNLRYPGPEDDIEGCTLYVPEHLVEEYRRHPKWGKLKIAKIGDENGL